MASKNGLDSQLVLDGLSQGVLIFDSVNRLVTDNHAARAMLGADLKLIRSEGWMAAAVLFNSKLTDPGEMIETARARALDSDQPVRFHIYRSGERIPCWISALRGYDDLYTMVTIELPDWTAIGDIVEKYVEEVREVVISTRGHASLIAQSVTRAKPDETNEKLGKRIGGFTRVIDIHMYRLHVLTDLMDRLERIRTGKVHDLVATTTREFSLANFMEDFLEVIDEIELVDPETEATDHRRRIRSVVPPEITIYCAPEYLAQVLHDIIRNAIMYSMRGTPINIVAYVSWDHSVQIDVIDEGYGIRAVENERVFLPFIRSRQPQIMAEFGYGVSLHLCKHEVEAMNGRIWFQSEEGVGTTFSLKLPAAPSLSSEQ
ncbi:MAG: HAMP domain-containing sensor histidine kinase [Chloroflexota bacterium]